MYKTADHYGRLAYRQGYASRAVYKLQQMQQRYSILQQHQRVIELGASPGSWTRYTSQIIGSKGQVVSVDLSPLPFSLPNVNHVVADVYHWSPPVDFVSSFDVVLSDLMTPTSGVREIDSQQSQSLCLRSLQLSQLLLLAGGSCVAKVFQSADVSSIIRQYQQVFNRVELMKPAASRANSREIFIIARNKKR